MIHTRGTKKEQGEKSGGSGQGYRLQVQSYRFKVKGSRLGCRPCDRHQNPASRIEHPELSKRKILRFNTTFQIQHAVILRIFLLSNIFRLRASRNPASRTEHPPSARFCASILRSNTARSNFKDISTIQHPILRLPASKNPESSQRKILRFNTTFQIQHAVVLRIFQRSNILRLPGSRIEHPRIHHQNYIHRKNTERALSLKSFTRRQNINNAGEPASVKD